jgi:hypothetical protein
MFKLNTSPTFRWPVAFTTINEIGDIVDQQFTAVFKRLPKEKSLELGKAGNSGALVSLDDLQGLRTLATSDDSESSNELVDKIDKLVEKLTAVKTGPQVLDESVANIMQFMSGWEGVDVGGSTEFNEDNLRLILNVVPNIEYIISKAFFDANVSGNHGKKTSKKPPATGR